MSRTIFGTVFYGTVLRYGVLFAVCQYGYKESRV